MYFRSGAAPTLSQPAGSIPPWSIYAEEAHLMVMRLREEKEQEMKKLNNEWHKKMETREEEVRIVSCYKLFRMIGNGIIKIFFT